MSVIKTTCQVRSLNGEWKPCLFYSLSLLVIVLLVVSAIFTQQFFEQRVRGEKGAMLTALIKQAEGALLDWHRHHERMVTSWAQTTSVREMTASLLEYPTDEALLKTAHEQEALREMLSPLVAADNYHLDYFIISTEKINLASHSGINLGAISNIPEHILDKAIAGHVVNSLPQKVNISHSDADNNPLFDQPAMFTVAPVKGRSGEIIALLALKINPVKDLATIFQQSRQGEFDEIYLFNKAGYLLSESRFTETLWGMGLLESGQSSILNLQLRDPGGNMMMGYRPETPRSQQPLTLMAERAINGEDGKNMDGYNDYRGVPVIGIWHWNGALGMGIAAEIDVQEAYATRLLLRKVMAFGVAFSVLIIVVFNLFFTFARNSVAKGKISLVNAQRMAHLGSWDWDVIRNRLVWSAETYRIFRQPPEQFEVCYETFLELVHPDDRNNVKAEMKNTLNNGQPYEAEMRIICPDGTERIVFMKAEIERNTRSDPSRMYGSVLDVTERKKAEQELILFKTTSDMIEDGVFMFSPGSLKFFYVNQAAVRQLGFTQAELFSMRLTDITPSFDEEAFRALMTPMMMEGAERTLLFQTEFQRNDRTLAPVDVVLQYLAPKDESPRFVAIARDFSARRRIEDQLKAEKEKAEQATQSKSEFLANMSHEIRTPMNGVLGMLELLSITPLTEKQTGYLYTAESSAKSLLTVINDVLDFSKIEAGKMQLESAVFNLHEVVEDSVRSMSKQADAKQLDLNCYISTEVPLLVIGDPVRLRQIITNLVNNAIKFTMSGEVNFRLCKKSDNGNLVRLRFEVEDTGIGIEKNQLEKLFDAFTQADGSTTRRYGGTGLGLSICRQLVSMMHGEMSVNSDLGEGSIFTFHIILSKVEQRLERRENGLLQDIRVLVVDHSDTNRKILGSYLSSWKVQNADVGDSDVVLPTLRDAINNDKPYQIILLDLQMEKVDGLKLAQMIKAEQDLQYIHIVTLGSLTEDADTIEDNHLIDYQLTRPVRQSSLFEALLQVTDQEETQHREEDAFKQPDIIFSGARVLLVDDATTNQAVELEMLYTLGVETVLVNNGRAALREIKKSEFDLVLMDCQMPIMDGYTATGIIRAQEKAKGLEHLTIIALTANAMKGDREVCVAAGMDDYLAKPVTLDKIRRILSQWLPDDKQYQISRDAIEVNHTEVTASAAENNISDSTDVGNAALDKKRVEDLRQLAGKRFRLLINSFERDVKKHLRLLHSAIKQNDPEKVALAAHALKGVGMSMAAIQFSNNCKKLEMQALDNDVVEAQSQLKNIQAEYQRAIKSLRKLN
ncbi:MAG: response regulator [Gammaproteobacteria bacterium]|nr:response regulator [Gammaproteobacteria bacterium]